MRGPMPVRIACARSASPFRLIFSAGPFPGYTAKLEWRRTEFEGNWYYSSQYDMEGWLCPALLKYFPEAPKQFCVQTKSRDQSGGAN